jgi:hypothetical protein
MVVGRRNRAEVTIGLLRRLRLQVLSATKVFPIWMRIVGTRDPSELLDVIDAYLDKRTSWDEALMAQNTFGAALSNVGALPAQDRYVVYAGYAATCAVLTALKDSDLEDDGLQDRQIDYWDGALYACAAFSGDMPWMAQSDRVKRVEFWTWWLDQAALVERVPKDADWATLRLVGGVAAMKRG